VSSSHIRALVLAGEVDVAAQLLGAPFQIRGEVIGGDRRGRTLGFPTANLQLADDGIPDGVWAGWFDVGAQRHLCAISIGRRPTFYAERGVRLLEAHIIDFDADIYGESVTVTPLRWLRGQRAFESPADLVAQLQRDVEECRGTSASLR
jgi:riboflavin kinase/FMN adenylyltransferase